jgi:hypothetical protein
MIQTRSLLRLGIAAAAITLLCACGGDDQADLAGPCSSETKKEAPKADAKTEAAGAQGGWTTSLSDADFVTYGQQIFLAKGSNTCNDCHGKDGKKGRLEQAADLTQPANWRATKALDGDTAKVNSALTYLISNGGKKFNENYVQTNADAGWSWEKTGATQYDIQMFGVTQSSTRAVIKNIRKALKKKGVSMGKDEMTDFGTRAVLAYLASIAAEAPAADGKSKGGKKKKGKKKKGKKKR